MVISATLVGCAKRPWRCDTCRELIEVAASYVALFGMAETGDPPYRIRLCLTCAEKSPDGKIVAAASSRATCFCGGFPPQGSKMTGVFVAWNPDNPLSLAGWIEDGSGCHIWAGARDAAGYGKVYAEGRMHSVHRLRYEREVGPIPDGLVLDHFACDNGPGGCCNPLHCRPVTDRENVLRGNGPTAWNAAKSQCVKGHELTDDNTYHGPTGRECRVCRRATSRAREETRPARNRGHRSDDRLAIQNVNCPECGAVSGMPCTGLRAWKGRAIKGIHVARYFAQFPERLHPGRADG